VLHLLAEAMIENNPFIRQFVTCNHGSQFADKICVEDSRYFARLMRVLYVLSGRPTKGILGYDRDAILAMISSPRKRFVWATIFRLPSQLSALLLRLTMRGAPLLPLHDRLIRIFTGV
jgi:hypothetical protein